MFSSSSSCSSSSHHLSLPLLFHFLCLFFSLHFLRLLLFSSAFFSSSRRRRCRHLPPPICFSAQLDRVLLLDPHDGNAFCVDGHNMNGSAQPRFACGNATSFECFFLPLSSCTLDDALAWPRRLGGGGGGGGTGTGTGGGGTGGTGGGTAPPRASGVLRVLPGGRAGQSPSAPHHRPRSRLLPQRRPGRRARRRRGPVPSPCGDLCSPGGRRRRQRRRQRRGR